MASFVLLGTRLSGVSDYRLELGLKSLALILPQANLLIPFYSPRDAFCGQFNILFPIQPIESIYFIRLNLFHGFRIDEILGKSQLENLKVVRWFCSLL